VELLAILCRYLDAVITKEWLPLVIGGILSGLPWWIRPLLPKKLNDRIDQDLDRYAKRIAVAILLLSFIVANFLAWRDQYHLFEGEHTKYENEHTLYETAKQDYRDIKRKIDEEDTVKMSGEILSVIKSPIQLNGDRYIFFSVRIHSEGARTSITNFDVKVHFPNQKIQDVELQRFFIPDRGIQIFHMTYHPLHTIFEKARYGVSKRQSVDGVMLYLFRDAKKYEEYDHQWEISFHDGEGKEYHMSLSKDFSEKVARIHVAHEVGILSAPKAIMRGSL
jgi:hypothetical protein